MNLEKLKLDNSPDLKKVLRVPLKRINFVSAKQIAKIMNSADKKITARLYPMSTLKRAEKCLLDYNKWSYRQICLAIEDGKIYCWNKGSKQKKTSTYRRIQESIRHNW